MVIRHGGGGCSGGCRGTPALVGTGTILNEGAVQKRPNQRLFRTVVEERLCTGMGEEGALVDEQHVVRKLPCEAEFVGGHDAVRAVVSQVGDEIQYFSGH